MDYNTKVINKYKVFNQLKLSSKFLKTIKIFYVFGQNGGQALIVTKDDLVYESVSSGGRYKLIKVDDLCNKEVIKFDSGSGGSHAHVLALTRNAGLYAWGNNCYGQLGNGTTNDCDTPQFVSALRGKSLVDMACGSYHSLVLDEHNGEVYAFGGNTHGQVCAETGVNSQSMPICVKYLDNRLKNIVQIACGSRHSLALSKNGVVYGWGNNKFYQLTADNNEDQRSVIKIKIHNNITIDKICCGIYNTLLLSRNGNLYAFGANKFSEFDTVQKIIYKFSADDPINPFTVKFKDISASHYTPVSVALSTKNTIYVWGRGKHIWPQKKKVSSILEAFANYSSKPQITHRSINIMSEFILTQNGKYEREFSDICSLGCGGFGTVFKSMSLKDGKTYAIKKVAMSRQNVDRYLKELLYLNDMQSDFVVKCFDSWLEDNYYGNTIATHNRTPTELDITSSNLLFNPYSTILLHIQMDYCELTLVDAIDTIQTSLTIANSTALTPIGYYISSELVAEILESVDYMHKKNIIHRDLKPANILLSNGMDGRFVKLADFGLSTGHDFHDQSHTAAKGTPRYIAPEVITTRKYTTKADLYSLGVIMNTFFDVDVYDEEIRFDVECDEWLIDKYKSVSNVIRSLVSTDISERKECEQVLDEKHLWAITIEELIRDNSFLNVVNNTPKALSLKQSFQHFFLQKKFYVYKHNQKN